MNQGKLIKQIPNLLTLINLSFGIGVMLLLVLSDHPHKITIAPVFILLGACCDFFDGFFARKLNAVTTLGKQLDSFADVVTFGLAPILLLNYTSTDKPVVLVVGLSLMFITAGVYRLSRYNLSDSKHYFLGLPITASGTFLTIYCMVRPLWSFYLHAYLCTTITVVFVVLLSGLMISKKKVKRITF